VNVAVIGAGAAGLVCARELNAVGLRPVVFEAAAEVGGIWNYRPEVDGDSSGRDRSDTVHGSMYASLRTNLPRELMAFRNFPFDGSGGGEDEWPQFLGHHEVLLYLQRFARHFDVERFVRLGHRVDAVERTDGGWVVETTASGRRERHPFSAVAVCNGHYQRPHVPDLPGLDGFEGRLVHSHNYREPEPFRGAKVVLLGAKSSGIDLAAELCEVAASVTLCARDHEALPRRRGIEHRPAIAAIHAPARLELTDGSDLDGVDALILCTGYRYDFPFLPRQPDYVTLEDKWVHPLWLDMLAIEAPTMAFIGLPFQVVPFPQMEIQSRLFAHLLAGRVTRRSRSALLAEHRSHVEDLVARGVQRRHYFRHGPYQFTYFDTLARIVGSPPLPPWFRPLYEAVSSEKKRDPDGYRSKTFPLTF
jgi:cation diffusion facilitator CzcD-associated flavoprotein CzcO